MDCPACTAADLNPRAAYITLIDGRIVARDAAEWAAECLARHVLSLPLAERREWLADYERKRGKSAADALRAGMTAVHAAGRVAVDKQGRVQA